MSKYSIMLKYNILYLTAFSAACLMVTSCGDDTPPAKPKLSFASSEMTVKESDGTIEAQLVLDKPASKDIIIDYKVSGTAKDDVAAGTTAPSDYTINGTYGEVTIAKGETTGSISFEIYSDSDFEDDETIIFSIDKVDSEDIEITREDDITITVTQEDGLIILLEWGVGASPAYTDVDMDLFLWAENSSSVLVRTGYIGLSGSTYTSLRASTTSPEYMFLPTALADDGTFGLSCTYYAGTKEPMDFKVSFIEIIDENDVSTVTKEGSYTQANINKWDDAATGTDPVLVFQFTKAGTDFKDFTDFELPTAGSRFGSPSEIPLNIKRQTGRYSKSENIKTLLKK